MKIKYEKTSQLLETLFNAYEKESVEETVLQVDEEDDCASDSYCSEQNDEKSEPLDTLLPFCDAGNLESILNNSLNDNEILLVVTVPEVNEVDSSVIVDSKVHEQINGTVTEKSLIELKEEVDLNGSIYNHICPMCRIELPNALELREHAVTHKILKKYLNGQRIPSMARFVAKHRETITIFNRPSKLYQCVFCTDKLPIEKFQSHIISHHNQTEFTCDKCNRVFRKLNHFKNHRISHLKVLPFQCEICDKGFVLKINYDCHMLTHTKPDNLPYKCEKCPKSYANKKHLYHHSFRHTDEGSFWVRYKIHRCRTCLRTFESANDLQQHSLQTHDKVIKKRIRSKMKININANGLFECKICADTYENVIALRQHIRKTHESRSLCSRCGASVLNLKQHMLSHEEREPIECHICQKLLSSKVTLTKHVRIHTGERPYQCSFCGKAFKDHHTMRVHERIHKGDKKHVCPICEKGFLEKPYMMKHLKGVHGK